MQNVQIVSTGSYLPGEPLTNQDLESLIGIVSPDLLAQIRVESRHWLVNPITGEHRESNSDMAAKAVREALTLANLNTSDVELLILSTSSPDHPLPPMVSLVQEKLGIASCTTLQLHSGAAGAVAALDLARLYLERGIYQTAVVVGSEAISPLLVPTLQSKNLRVRDRLGIYSFGDGAGAIVLQAVTSTPGIESVNMRSPGGNQKPGMFISIGGTHTPLSEQLSKSQQMPLQVDFGTSAKFTPHLLTEALNHTLESSSSQVEDFDACILPTNIEQLKNELTQEGLLTPQWLNLESKLVENLKFVGSTGSAALPLSLDYAWKTARVKLGDRVMLLAYEISKWIYGGMVLTWTAPPLVTEDQKHGKVLIGH